MAQFTVASVPYVNAAPLVWWFEAMGEASPVRVVYDVPSRLPALLDSGEADAILVSSVDALRTPGRRVLSAPAIATRGAVRSVRVFSNVPPNEVKTLAWDASSMTSNRLAMVLLGEMFGARPRPVEMAPDLTSMLAVCDACVLIGDNGMTADGAGLHTLDLGEAWTELTGAPFVWAVWAGNARLTPELGAVLHEGWLKSGCGSHTVSRPETGLAVSWAAERAGWSIELADSYLNETMDFSSDTFFEASLRSFEALLLAHGFADCRHFPEIIELTVASK